jgi:uncharacterized protein involved in exopolysaccharide biosynthesis
MIPNSETMQVSFQDYLAIVVRRRWFFVAPLLAVVAVAMIVGMFLPRIYRAETTLLIQDPKIMNPLIQGMAVSTPVQTRMRVVQEELLGWTSLSRLVHELGLDRKAKSQLAFESIVRGLRRDISVSTRGGSLIRLTYRNENPELAQRVLNTITNIYIQRNVESQTAEAETAIRFIESEMEGYRKRLEDSERALREFKEIHAMEMPVAMQLNRQIIGLEVRLAQLLVDSTEEHPVVIQIRRSIQDLKLKRNEEVLRVIAQSMAKSGNTEIYGDLIGALSSGQEPTNPKVKEARDAYQAWVARLDSPARDRDAAQGATVQVVQAPSEGDEAGSAADDALASSGILSLTLGPRQEQELVRLQRDYKVHAASYQQMKTRLERARITQRLGESDEGTKFKIIEPARLPLRPVSPNLWLIFTTSLMAGAFLGVCAAFGAEYLDQSFQSADEVQAALAMPVVGSISTIVTEADIKDRRRRYRSWLSYRDQMDRVNRRVVHPVWERIDQALLKWGL